MTSQLQLSWLWPLSVPYRAAVQTRNRLYDIGVLPTYHVDARVISVGNLSVGGTGKTPFVIHLLERIRRLNPGRLKLGVVSRGYRGSARGRVLVSDGRKLLASAEGAGDEPFLIAESSPGTVVIVDRNRVRGARFAADDHRVRVIILDDGFQHRRLGRHLDIVLLDASNPLGNRMLLPAGFLREPAGSLARADLVVLSKSTVSDGEMSERCGRLAGLIGRPVISTRLAPKRWRRFARGEKRAAEQVSGRRVTAFAGIAHPASFFGTVRSLGAELAETIALSDHCRYRKADLDLVAGRFIRSKSEWMVTTAKDAVKLPPIMRLLPVYYLETAMEVMVGEEKLDEMLTDVLKGD